MNELKAYCLKLAIQPDKTLQEIVYTAECYLKWFNEPPKEIKYGSEWISFDGDIVTLATAAGSFTIPFDHLYELVKKQK